MKFKKLIAAGLTAAMFMTAGIGVSAAGSTKVTGKANVGYSQGSNFDDFEVDHLYWTEGEQICRIYGYTGSGGDVVIPNGVNWIQGGTFENCTSLKSITLPNSVTTIEYGAFKGCTSLTGIKMGNSVKTMCSPDGN